MIADDAETQDIIVEKKDEYLHRKKLFNEALKHQREVIQVTHSFCYITIRNGLVKSKTDEEWHVDGFSTKINLFLKFFSLSI